MKSLSYFALPIGLGISLALAGCNGETNQVPESQSAQAAPQSDAANASAIRDISASEVDGLLGGEEGAVVLDVRTAPEFEAGHIDGAVNVDFLSDDFAQQLAQLDRDTTYILHCKSGSRSAQALELMETQGFTSVAHLTEGYDGWKAASEDASADGIADGNRAE